MSPPAYIAHMSPLAPTMLPRSTANPDAVFASAVSFAVADSDQAILACHSLMQALRPRLADAQAFLAQVRRMQTQAYVLMAAWRQEAKAGATAELAQQPLALAAYRISETLLYGPYLYVDDLVTSPALRGQGLGHALLQHIFALAHAQGLNRVVLDTRLDNLAAQRFYQRAGMQAQAMRFSLSLRAELKE